jgi:hypothetical protein
MRIASIIQWSIMAIGFLAMLLPPPNRTGSLIMYTFMSIGGITSLCHIITHHTASSNHWCLPIGIPAGVVVGGLEFRAFTPGKDRPLDPKADLRPFWTLSKAVWSLILCEISFLWSEPERFWCEATGGRWDEEEAARLNEL